MDMISVISAERVIPAYDLLTSLGLPELKHAKGIGFYPNRFASPADLIYVMSAEGTYKLDRETFKTDESLEIGNIDFILPLVNEYVVCYTSVNNASTAGALASLCVTDAGNAYAQVRITLVPLLNTRLTRRNGERLRNIRWLLTWG